VIALKTSSSALLPFLAKLEGYGRLPAEDREALLQLPHSQRTLSRSGHILREGESATTCCVILDGYACRHKILPNGSRQILSVHMKGDGVDLQNAFIPVPDYNLQTLTAAEVALIPVAAIAEIMASRPAIARAFFIEMLLDAAIQREWTVNVGRRDARTRIAHFLCELGVRCETAHTGERMRYPFPITQEHVADVTGLTPVHVNRVFQSLRADDLLATGDRTLVVKDWPALAAAGAFRSDYLNPVRGMG
jgi:CRP-like cAMP-binding protein